MRKNARKNRRDGMALVTLLIVTTVLLVLGGTLLSLTTTEARQARNDETRAITAHTAEAGGNALILRLWSAFAPTQRFDADDMACSAASLTSPASRISGRLTADATDYGYLYRYAASVTRYRVLDAYTRDLDIRATGWVDLDGSGGSAPDPGEPATILELHVRLVLRRARVFDYAYFVNNHGWMTGFNSNNLWVNGDMRANGDFNIDGGTVNGQIIATANKDVYNDRLNKWGADGVANVSGTYSMSDATYNAQMASATQGRARQAYDPAVQGAKNSTAFASWKDIVYDQNPDPTVYVNSDIPVYGAYIADVNGVRRLDNQSVQINTAPTQPLTMPDLSDITYYRDQISATYRDPKQTFADGTANPDYNQPAYLEAWDSTQNKYVRLSGQSGDAAGTVSGSALLVGTSAHPIKIHGPVTVMGDVGIKGVVQGQGTLYTGRNVHVLGDVTYNDPPHFDGSGAHGNTPAGIDEDTDQKTVLGLCARGSVIMGNPGSFGNDPLQYMTPPFTRSRRDPTTGQIIPPFDARQTDTGYTTADGITPKKYQSLLKQADITKNASAVNRIDAVMYTNNCAGGLCGDGSGKGFTINGTIVAKDEAMVVNLGSGRMTLNYDTRIKERSISNQPLIDINLPRSPELWRMTWREVQP